MLKAFDVEDIGYGSLDEYYKNAAKAGTQIRFARVQCDSGMLYHTHTTLTLL